MPIDVDDTCLWPLPRRVTPLERGAVEAIHRFPRHHLRCHLRLRGLRLRGHVVLPTVAQRFRRDCQEMARRQ